MVRKAFFKKKNLQLNALNNWKSTKVVKDIVAATLGGSSISESACLPFGIDCDVRLES